MAAEHAPAVGNEQARWSGLAISGVMNRRPWLVLGALLLVTMALGWPMVYWGSDATASQSPVTEITETQELVAERFADDVFRYFLLVEANDGEILDKAPLLELFRNTETMREQPATASLLVELRDPTLGIDVEGVWTLADSVDRLLRQAGVVDGLGGATEEQIDDAIGA